MINKKFYMVLFLLILALVSCGNKKDKNKEIQPKPIGETLEQTVFKEKSIEKIIDDFEKNSKKNHIQMAAFEKIVFENKDFYHAKIGLKKNSNYTIGYRGINAIGLFLKVEIVDGSELSIIEDMVVNLIQVSDGSISEEEARNLYTEILVKMGENEISSSVKYKNGLVYGIQIGQESGELVFSAQ